MTHGGKDSGDRIDCALNENDENASVHQERTTLSATVRVTRWLLVTIFFGIARKILPIERIGKKSGERPKQGTRAFPASEQPWESSDAGGNA